MGHGYLPRYFTFKNILKGRNDIFYFKSSLRVLVCISRFSAVLITMFPISNFNSYLEQEVLVFYESELRLVLYLPRMKCKRAVIEEVQFRERYNFRNLEITMPTLGTCSISFFLPYQLSVIIDIPFAPTLYFSRLSKLVYLTGIRKSTQVGLTFPLNLYHTRTFLKYSYFC